MNEDTLKLLNSLSYGAKMSVQSCDEILKHIKSCQMKNTVEEFKSSHEILNAKINGMLEIEDEDSKSPNFMAKGMTWAKINFELLKEKDDEKAMAGLITDGCNMGIKLLNHYLNDYMNADDSAKDIVYEMIELQKSCMEKIKIFL